SDHLESSMTSSTDHQFSRPLKKVPKEPFDDALPKTSHTSRYEFDTNLKVKFQDKFFYVWDTNVCVQNDCHKILFIHVNVERPRNLLSLFGQKPNINLSSNFYFKYILFGHQVKTNSFLDLGSYEDFKAHKF